MRRVIALFLDGYEPSLQQRMIDTGELPALAALGRRCARFALDHGDARNSGLAGEHVATGLSPQDARRHAAVHFDPRGYRVCQVGAVHPPFPARLPRRTVAFDMPYFDLAAAPGVAGIGNWGAHDPGVPASFQPAALQAEFERHIGAYPASRWIYGYTWPSPERTRAMADDLVRAVDLRADAACWLLERVSGWQLALLAVSEPHSAVEALWHGIDPAHPLHGLPSAAPAGEGVRAVYRAVDRLVDRLQRAWPDADLVVFSMHGMGTNRSDTISMLMLSELMHRHAFGQPLWRADASATLREGVAWPVDPDSWEASMRRGFPAWRPSQWRAHLAWNGTAPVRRLLAWEDALRMRATRGAARMGLDWMPAIAYRPYWRDMDAFALPSFYDGRLRVNLAGRERHGRVSLAAYRGTVAALEALLRRCVDADTGEPLVERVQTLGEADPMRLDPTGADLTIVWRRSAQTLRHPTLGTIGPVPMRRPGGHTGREGMAWIRATDARPGFHGVRSAFDVVPTLLALLGATVPGPVSGRPLPIAGRVEHEVTVA